MFGVRTERAGSAKHPLLYLGLLMSAGTISLAAQNAKPAIWFTVADVKTAYEHLKKKGIVFLSEPFEIMTGLAAEFNDPFGNKLGITHYSKVNEHF